MFLFQSTPQTLCSNSWREWFYRFNGLSADRCQHDKADASTVDHAPATPHGQIQVEIQMGEIQIWIEMQIKMDTSIYCTVQSILLILSYLATFRHVWLWGMGLTCECTLQLDIVYSPGHCLMRPRILQMFYQAQISRGMDDYRIGQFGFWFSWPVSNCLSLKILFSIVANETMLTICSEGWVIMQEQRN